MAGFPLGLSAEKKPQKVSSSKRSKIANTRMNADESQR